MNSLSTGVQNFVHVSKDAVLQMLLHKTARILNYEISAATNYLGYDNYFRRPHNQWSKGSKSRAIKV